MHRVVALGICRALKKQIESRLGSIEASLFLVDFAHWYGACRQRESIQISPLHELLGIVRYSYIYKTTRQVKERRQALQRQDSLLRHVKMPVT
jgi:hypothetical protein